MHRLWITIGSVVTVVALVLATVSAVNLVAHEEITEVDTFPAAAVDALDLAGDNGNVEVVGAAVTEIRVVAEVDHGLRRTSTTAEVRDGTLVVRNDCPSGPPIWCRVDYRIVVPHELPVTMEGDNGNVVARDLGEGISARTSNGNLDVARIAGPVELSSRNGGIEARNLRSDDVVASTRNGSVGLSFAVAPHHVDADTRNGSIEVVVPDDGATYRVETNAQVLGVTDTAVRTDPGSDRVIEARTANGSITVRYPTG